MEFRAVFIANPAHLSAWQNQLVIRGQREASIPMEDISSLLIESQSVTLTAAALQQLTAHGVTVYFCDEKHMPAAIALPMNQYSRQLKLLKLQTSMTQPTRKRLWQTVVRAKIANQSRCLAMLDRPEAGDLRQLAREIRSGDPDNLEATAAVAYFPALFGSDFTRGQDCLVNAGLNYGYAILRGAMARNLVIHGLEPCLGIFHRSELNQFNLADDLMEPFRPLVDLFVASHLAQSDADTLTSAMKQQLFNLTNYLLQQSSKRYRMISAVGRTAESFSRVLRGEDSELELPELLPLESYRYE